LGRPAGAPGPWRSRALRGAAASLAGALLVAGVGCGEGEGVADDATVAAYVAAPLCAGAKGELEREDGAAGDLAVRAVCLPAVERGGRSSLAIVGANARRAAEDSTAVGYLEPPGTAVRFSRPILESAGIAWLQDGSGARGMSRLLDAIREAGGSDSLREAVADALDGP
jgi:hypothetical protein